MTSHYITYRQSRIHYRKIGSGHIISVCFHGFGEFAATFDQVKDHLPEQITLLSIDLPFHGETVWNEGLDFTPDELLCIINSLPEIKENMFGLIGYSMGGRVALSLFQFIPARITHILLMAPDGLKVNFWYWFATQTSAGNRLFSYTMRRPGWFVNMLALLKKTGLANESIIKFVNKYLDDKVMREKIYTIWTVMRKFKPALKKIKQLVKKKNIPLKIVYGRYDRIIRYHTGLSFAQDIKEHCEIVILDCGHQVLHRKNAEQIAWALHQNISHLNVSS
jgi:pimeloyl-ACP methyl ester carboxylesterase